VQYGVVHNKPVLNSFGQKQFDLLRNPDDRPGTLLDNPLRSWFLQSAPYSRLSMNRTRVQAAALTLEKCQWSALKSEQ